MHAPADRLDDRVVRAARDALLERGAQRTSSPVRPVVADSWMRSLAAGVSPDESRAPLAMDASELADYREAHPLAQVFPLLRDVLGRAAEDVDGLLAVGDASGRLLWVCGQRSVLRQAERINFQPGAQWDETSAGTNAPGTALRLDQPVTIRAGEHFARPVQRWSCAAAPIHHPRTAEILGIVDVTGGDRIGEVQTLAMVRAAARMAEAELGRLELLAGARSRPVSVAVARPGTGWPVTRIEALGRDEATVHRDGASTLSLTRRHSDILVLLAEYPEGMNGDELAVRLYPESGPVASTLTSTIRAELTRLRTLLGTDVIGSRPYRLLGDPVADWQQVYRRLTTGELVAAVRGYGGPLLPGSQAPGVERVRRRLEAALRSAVLAGSSADLLATWTRSRWGADDVEAWTRLRDLLPSGSPLRPLAEAELTRLDAELR